MNLHLGWRCNRLNLENSRVKRGNAMLLEKQNSSNKFTVELLAKLIV